MKWSPFTEMSFHTFGGDTGNFSKMLDLMNDHLFCSFYNKISGMSLSQWIPAHLHQCCQRIFDALLSGAIEETEYMTGEVIQEKIIWHHFKLDSFCSFGFLEYFALPTALPGTSAMRQENFDHDIQHSLYSGYLWQHGLKAQVV